jgi:hypothetical protein
VFQTSSVLSIFRHMLQALPMDVLKVDRGCCICCKGIDGWRTAAYRRVSFLTCRASPSPLLSLPSIPFLLFLPSRNSSLSLTSAMPEEVVAPGGPTAVRCPSPRYTGNRAIAGVQTQASVRKSGR